MTAPRPAVTGAPVTGAPAAGQVRVVLALGSNLGSRLANLQAGIDALCAAPGLARIAVSPVYETAPVGGPPQPDFLNAVLTAVTGEPAGSLLDRCWTAEAARQRVRGETWGPRTLDVDIVLYGDLVCSGPRLTVPHPRAHERAFVLAPWLDVEPGALIPGRGPVAALLALAGRDGVRRVPGTGLSVPR